MLCGIIPLNSSVFASDTKNTKSYARTFWYKSYKDISLRYISINKMKKQTERLSAVDKEILSKYIFGAVKGEDTFLLINSHLRGNLKDYIPAKEITKPLGCRLNYYAETLKNSISKVNLPQNTTLYAAIDEKYLKHLLYKYNIADLIQKPVTYENGEKIAQKIVGVKFREKGFLSASYDKNCIDKTKFRLEIKAPKNTHAVLTEDLGEKSKKKVVINSDYDWEIIAVECEYDKDNKKSYYNIIIKNIK